MPTIESHAPGNFCWFELTTTDQADAKRFYASLFGWGVKDTPIGPDEVYTLFQIDGRDVAAGYTMRTPERQMGIPPHWLVYIRVESCVASAAKAAAAGGKVVAPPFDVMDLGRMAVVQDPTGAMFAIWQPGKNSGTGLAGEIGTVVWADLMGPDQVKAGAFYSALLGWKMVEGESMVPAKPGQYFHIVNGQDMIGGVPPSEFVPPGVPAHWLIYVSVADCAATVTKAADLGGNVIYGPMPIEGTGIYAAISDPQGAVFAIIQLTR